MDSDSVSNVRSPIVTVSHDSRPAAVIAGADAEVDNETNTDGAFWEATATRPSVPTDSEEQPQEYALPHV